MTFPCAAHTRSSLFVLASVLVVVVINCGRLEAQDYVYQTGLPAFTTAQPVPLGIVDVSNGNLHIEIPIASAPVRGKVQFSGKLVYDSRVWTPFFNGTSTVWSPTNAPGTQGGWRYVTTADIGSLYHATNTELCYDELHQPTFTQYSDFTWTAPDGTQHYFPVFTEKDPNNCDTGNITSDTEMASDSSGYEIVVTNYTVATIYAKDGTQVYPTLKDTNGNYYSLDGSGNVQDTLGRVPVQATTNGNTTTYSVLNSQGSRSTYTVAFGSYPYNTAFNAPGITDVSGSLTAISYILLPDNSEYNFGYDSYGELHTIQLPTGGQVTFGYTNFTDAYGTENRWVSSYASTDGSWTYSPQVVSTCPQGGQNCQQQVTVAKPSGDTIVYLFTMNGGAWDSQAQFKDSGGTVLATVTQSWDMSNTCNGCQGAGYVRKLTQTTSIPSAGGVTLNAQTQYSYDSPQFANLTSMKEWNFYTGSPGATADRETDISYVISTPYVNANILSLPSTVTVYAAGSQIGQTNYSYDSTGLTSITGIVQHDDTNFGTGNTVRGNLTGIQRWVAPSTYLPTVNFWYDTTGQMIRQSDVAGNQTQYVYADSFFNDNGANPPASTSPPAGPTNAYVTTIQLPLIGNETFGYYYGTGKQAVATDSNGASSYQHFVDVLDRPSLTMNPVGGWKLFSFTSTTNDVYAALTSANPSQSCTSCGHSSVALDGLGRANRMSVLSDPDGNDYVDLSYDSNGRLQIVSNSYRNTSEPTYGTTTTSYDALDRVKQITRPDNNTVRTAYGASLGAASQTCAPGTYGFGFPSRMTDETGRQRQYWTDAFGRLIEVDEPDGSGNLTIATCYKYDGFNNLISATQQGGTIDSSQWRTRTFTYDGVSRMTSSATPEAGTVNFYYTTAGGGVCSGNPNAVCRRVDARSITTTYAYDALVRLTSKSYSDSTPTVNYYYDQVSFNGLSIAYGKGRLTGMSDGSGQTAWTYDAAGDILTKRQTIAGNTKSISFTYNLDGSVASITYPSGRVITYGYNNALQPISATDVGLGTNYVSNAHYTAAGTMSSNYHGQVPGWIAITKTISYNNRYQPTRIVATTPVPSTLLDLGYTYDQGSGMNNGNIVHVDNNRDASRSVAYTYDSMNRLLSAGTYNSTQWGDSYVYDTWGNLLQKNVTQGTAETLTVAVDARNHLTGSGYTYDAAGNMLYDGANWMLYDAEDRASPQFGDTYLYDGKDHRVEKTADGTVYWFDDGFDTLGVGDTSGAVNTEYVYFNGQRIGFVDVPTGDPYYYLSDNIGSVRIMASGGGRATYADNDFYPWGREITSEGAVNFKFTGYEYDYATGYNFANYRYESKALGRFLSPDPAGITGVDMLNPQSWNAYPYALNNPCVYTDPLGLAPDCTLNINFQTNGYLNSAEAAQARNRIASLLSSAGVGAAFNSANADYTVSVVPTGKGGNDQFGDTPDSYLWGFGLHGVGAPGNSGKVFVLPIASEVKNQDVGFAAGTVATHELTHFLLGSLFPGSNQGYVEQQGAADASWMLNRALSFANAAAIHGACKLLHPNPNTTVKPGFFGLFAGGGGSGDNGTSYAGGGYPGWWYDMSSFLGWVDSIPIEVVTTKIIFPNEE